MIAKILSILFLASVSVISYHIFKFTKQIRTNRQVDNILKDCPKTEEDNRSNTEILIDEISSTTLEKSGGKYRKIYYVPDSDVEIL